MAKWKSAVEVAERQRNFCEFLKIEPVKLLCTAGARYSQKRLVDCNESLSDNCKFANVERNRYIEWWLKAILLNAGELSESDLNWATKMQDAYNRQGFLTKKQRDVLEGIYKRSGK